MIWLRNRYLLVTIQLLWNVGTTNALSLGRALNDYPPSNVLGEISTLVSAPVQVLLTPDDDDEGTQENKEGQTTIRTTMETTTTTTKDKKEEKTIESAIETLERDGTFFFSL